MSIYPGDTHNFLLVLTGTAGATPNVSGTPSITIIQVSTGTAQVTNASMALIAGTNKVYKFAWSIPATLAAGRYIAIGTYSVDLAGGSSFVANTGVFLESVLVGDSMIQGKVALDGTVAKDATVAKDSTVAHATDITALSPDNSATILAIKAKTDQLPAAPASETTLSSTKSICQNMLDGLLAHMTIDKTANPNTLTLRRFGDNAVLAVFTLADSGSSTTRTRTT